MQGETGNDTQRVATFDELIVLLTKCLFPTNALRC